LHSNVPHIFWYVHMQKVQTDAKNIEKTAIYILGTVNKSVALEMSQHTTTMSTQSVKCDRKLQQWAHNVLNVTGHCNNEQKLC